MKKIILLAIFILIACNKNADLQSPSTNSSESLNGKQNNEKSLQWSEQAISKMQWNEALNYCKNLSEGNHNDWRLPNIDELRTLIQASEARPDGECQISEKAGKLLLEDWNPKDCGLARSKLGDTDWLWSSSVQSNNSSIAWAVGFFDGRVNSCDKTFCNNNVRCVRVENNTVNAEISHIKNQSSPTNNLSWSKKSRNQMNWNDAMNYCKNLNKGGNNDWRLPNIDELRTLIQASEARTDGKCQISEKAGKLSSEDLTVDCFITRSKLGDTDWFWSSSVVSNHSDEGAWFVNFQNGSVNTNFKSSDNKYVRCVKGENNLANAEISHIKDSPSPTSTLSWSKKAPNYMFWGDAINYCKNLNEDGHDDWHLPTISELRTLIQNCPTIQTGGECKVTDSCLSYECWSKVCSSCVGGHSKLGDTNSFWSSSLLLDKYSDEAWFVNFSDGYVHWSHKTVYLYVRCVR